MSIEEGLRILGLKRGKKRKERLEKLLEMVGMSPDSADRYPHEFSGGQRQRICIARALSVDPSFKRSSGSPGIKLSFHLS
ncbi:MAG: ATP-binding cassette domain-containing protein [Deltaproteobacteria bacterium]|nr:ATP-binding cassette domain-containing protein [Deltaproteobacteria bacterium]